MNCKICNTQSDFLFEKRLLNKYDVKYFHCNHCDFIQTETPFWLEDAYKSVITALDIGLVQRNVHYYPIVAAIITKWFNRTGRFLDYGGGYGLLVRLMRDRGFDFYRQDSYCKNLFAEHFDIEDLYIRNDFELITAFELFEHLIDPIGEMKKLLSYSSNILFSTELHPGKMNFENWDYLSLETGQHIAFYGLRTLKYMANLFHLDLNTNKSSLHLLSHKKVSNDIFELLAKRKASVLYNSFQPKQLSLTLKDYAMIKKELNKTS